MNNLFRIYKAGAEESYEFDTNQYEEFWRGPINGFEKIVNARYIDQDVSMYRGNLLIESLIPIYTLGQVMRSIQHFPSYAESERFLNAELRMHSLYTLLDYFMFMDKHATAECQLSIVIRRAYTSKVITSKSYREKIRELAAFGNPYNDKSKDYDKWCDTNDREPILGFTMCGISGAGKTRTIKKILGLYPKAIRHTNYKGDKMLFYQLPYVFINCAHDGSIRMLCEEFFGEIDNTLGTNYKEQYANPKASAESMMKSMAFLAQKHAVGVLIVDEIQHIVKSKLGSDKIINYFVTMHNKVKIPIIFIGTNLIVNKALSKKYQAGRRAEGIGYIDFGIMEKGREWDGFIKKMWNYQYIKNKCELTPEFEEVMYEESFGIIDRAVKLYLIAQTKCILDGTETLTIELLRSVSNEELRLTKSIMDAFRNKDAHNSEEFDELRSINIVKYLETAIQKTKEKSGESTYNIDREARTSYIVEISHYLQDGGCAKAIAYDIAEKVLDEFGLGREMAFYKEKALDMRYKPQMGNAKIKKAKKTNENKESKKLKDNEELYNELEKSGGILDWSDGFEGAIRTSEEE